MPQQVSRLALLFAVGVAVLIGARLVLVPKTFGQFGHYRGAAVDSIAARPIKYASHQVCAGCHEEVHEKREEGNHRGVACEVCHGAQSAHVADPTGIKPPAPRDRGFCPLCHQYNPSRPTGFPQIDPVTHNPLTPCIRCHDPHAPVPPRTPSECGACHGQIARQKVASRHVDLRCTTCHGVPEQHKITPQAVRPTKPSDRKFCGKCHAPDAVPPAEVLYPRGMVRMIPAVAREIPRVDIDTHGGRYLCWQCHYPHYPEK
ncbi:MAG: hypothetical protein HY700_18640 [Gemmatimonadetes bacterium]|nr:hypothetical protein [Gemmatimonadota bacterium]